MNEPEADELPLEEVLGRAEFCWSSALVMTPIIWRLHRPSVSHDQFVVRTALVVIVAGRAIVLRARRRVKRR